MNIRQKMLLGAGALTIIPVALTALFLWTGATSLATETVSTQTQLQLSAIRDTKRQALSKEIDDRIKALQTLAAQRSTVDAYKQFKATFYSAAKDLAKVDVASATAEMNNYVKAQVTAEYTRRNAQAFPDVSSALASRDANGVLLQNEFIVANSNPLGQKEKLVTPAVDFPYGRAHAQYHPALERTQKLQGFYDIFFVDTDTDTLIYTVFKELDFATSLNTGIAAKSKLAEAYFKVKSSGKRDTTYLSDFAPYLPLYDDQAAFAGVPLFEGERQIGVLLMQFPIDALTEEMNSNKAWKAIGLGDTGDAFLVGGDKKMRSNARYVIENKDAFVQLMGEKLPPAERAALLKKNTSIGLVTVDSEATRPALSGQDGFADFIDYRGVPSYGAYGPLKAYGLNWIVVSKIDKAEANLPIGALNQASLLRALLVGLAVVVLAGALVAWFLRRFLEPINKLSDTVLSVAKGDLSARSKLVEKDEIGDLGRSFDTLLDDRIAGLEKARLENEGLNNSVISLLQTVFQMSNRDLTARAPVTEDVVGTVSSSINQLAVETGQTLSEVRDIAEQVRQASQSVRAQSLMVVETSEEEQRSLAAMSKALEQTTQQLTRVAALSARSNTAAESTTASTKQALTAVNGTVKGMNELRESISEMEKRFKRLGERSQEISTAVGLVNAISERTHVLALNASMQAATAGEAGRGFAVVAEEVQRLSDSSRQATAQISQLVNNIQGETSETVFTVNRLISDVVKQSELAQQAGVQMEQTQGATQDLVELVRQIALFSQSQNQLAKILQRGVSDLNEEATKTSRAITEQSQTTQTLVEFAERLTTSVGLFKLPERTN
ncbi:MAG: HAMP domain-containing protein [Betaproteobacteria bacterium]|nr:MAG: HAMP domain-containing protein [Betaproteobacteria bacterium]